MIDTRWNGLAHIIIFWDGEEEDPSVGQEIRNCPQCGEALSPKDFEELPF